VRIIAGLAGALWLLGTLASVVRTLIVPRGMPSRLVGTTWRITRIGLRGVARPLRTYESRDSVLAWLAPLLLLTTLVMWLVGLFAAYGLILYGVSDLTFPVALREAGSSLFTLGFASTDRSELQLVDFCAAATGPVVVALQIAYLPTLYAAYNRRECEVTLLQSRAGEPAWGPELLARQGLVGTTENLAELYRDWERLAADLGESHSNYPVLLSFRSPQPYRSWIVGLIAVMDAAALHLALCPSTAPRQARLMLRMSFTALRDIARVIRVPYDPDPLPEADLRLSYDEYVAGVARIAETGFLVERTAEEAWPHFRGWRVNYEEIAYELARRADAVPALWSGDRDFPSDPLPPRRPPNRVPGSPQATT
jgi:hypothetical protein